MKIPEFNAEVSLYKSKNQYSSAGRYIQNKMALVSPSVLKNIDTVQWEGGFADALGGGGGSGGSLGPHDACYCTRSLRTGGYACYCTHSGFIDIGPFGGESKPKGLYPRDNKPVS